MSAARHLAPEVVQTSAMDCGPAALCCLLEGFGIRASYGRLREACHTDVDGTSIDTLEDVAVQLGLDAEQVVVPADFVVLPEARSLPAIAVVVLPSGLTHFVVAWRRVGPWIQVMDPATGRRWIRVSAFTSRLYRHTSVVAAEDWREWAGTDGFWAPVAGGLRALGLGAGAARALVDEAAADPGWRSLAALDATTRLAAALTRASALPRRRVETFVRATWARAREDTSVVPARFWCVRELPEGELAFTGAVLVRTTGPSSAAEADRQPLSPELKAALAEPPERPLRDLARFVRQEGLLTPALIGAALLVGAGAILLEALVWRALLDLGHALQPVEARLAAIAALVVLGTALLALDVWTAHGLARLGRHLEVRVRAAFHHKVPRLGDRYFQSRLLSDMAGRVHTTSLLRTVPDLAGRAMAAAFGLALTALAITVLDPWLGPLALLAAAASIVLPLATWPMVAERELRLRTHAGTLSNAYLDTMLGLFPIRAHGAEGPVRREHEEQLVHWLGAGLAVQRVVAVTEGAQSLVGSLSAIGLLALHVWHRGEAGDALLVAWWALSLPTQGATLAAAARQLPAVRNTMLRVLEPLTAPERPEVEPAEDRPDGAVALRFEGVSVVASGQPILDGIDLELPAGAHVAIVGRSGAGKSSLLGVLLGWHRPAAGRVLVDGEPLDEAALRRRTAWVDPEVHVWNESLLTNLLYGNTGADGLGEAVDDAGLASVVEGLPKGFATPLGEGGGLVSGGQGQRVRLGRAMQRDTPGLVLLDEAFRGLDRDQRRALLARARERWRDATLLYVTHDLEATRGFDRVLVIEERRIVEDGSPEELAGRPGGAWSRLAATEESVRKSLWEGAGWRHLEVGAGTVTERPR